MAISRQGPIVGPISGTLSGAVFYQGQRSGVIGRQPHGFKADSPEQLKRQAALLKAQTKWRALPANYQLLWNTFAQTLPWHNRLGVRRPISGYNAFLSFLLQIDPHQNSGQSYPTPPLGISAPTPIISGAEFTADGTCIITTQAPTALYTFERLYLRTLRQYGPRTAPTRTTYIGALERTATDLDWNTISTPLDGMFKTGDQLELRIFWMVAWNWPSQRARIITTAL